MSRTPIPSVSLTIKSLPPIFTFVAFYLFSSLLISCANLQDEQDLANGIGGSGINGELDLANGLGGTGKQSPQERFLENELATMNGPGGTGFQSNKSGGTAIIGEISELGSIWVNGNHIFYDHSTYLTQNQSTFDKAFEVGEVVAARIYKNEGKLLAAEIDKVYELVGPVEQLDSANRSLQVLGQRLVLDEDTLIRRENSRLDFTLVEVGDWIAVSGLRNEKQEILATRIDLIDQLESNQLIGILKKNVFGQLSVGKLRLKLNENLANDFSVNKFAGKRVLISGFTQGKLLIVENISLSSTDHLILSADRLDIQTHQNNRYAYFGSFKAKLPSNDLTATDISTDLRYQAFLSNKGFVVNKVSTNSAASTQITQKLDLMPNFIGIKNSLLERETKSLLDEDRPKLKLQETDPLSDDQDMDIFEDWESGLEL